VVRVTTVHGAKGLEAPIVFLADAGPRGPSRRGRIHWTDPGVGGPMVALPLWRASAAERDALSEAIVQRDTVRELEERRRLLYVALTRARDRLYVTGWRMRGGREAAEAAGEPSWHELVSRALADLPGTQPIELAPPLALPGQGLRFIRGTGTHRAASMAAATLPPLPVPVWLDRPAPIEPEPPRTLAPSRAEGAEPGRAMAGDASLRLRRGALIHRLLQLLPDLPADERPAAAERLLTLLAADWLPEQRSDLARGVLALIGRPEFAAVFGPHSRAEQSICGTVGGRPLVGQIDRLVITPDEVLIVDLKSNRQPPADIMGAPAAYLAQLAAYRALLLALYPGRPVRAGLLWTELPRLDEVPAALLDRHAPDAA
jgi:ATP-dependent helicase/nuclease subunit A